MDYTFTNNLLIIEFSTEEDGREWASEHGYRVTKVQYGESEKACICYMTKS